MNIHEYQAKELLAKYGVAVPKGIAAMSVEEAVAAAKQLPGPLYVVKSQIHAGGRGKGKFKELGPDAKGGVRLAKTIEEVEAHAKDMLGNTLVTIQTGEAGKQVNRLYITDGADIKQEFYLALLVDRATSRIAVVASTEGGMDIETVAHDTPELITTFSVDPAQGFQPHHGRAVAFALKLTGDLNKQAAKLSGINVKAYRYLAGMITAVFVAIGGILVASRGSSAQVMCCDNYLMQSLAAVFVGRSVGGAERPNALGTLIGAMMVSTLENGLTICAVPFYVLPAVKGAVLALALVAAYATKKEQ